MIPGNSWTSVPEYSDFESGYSMSVTSPVYKFRGGRALSDTTAGNNSHNWSIYVSNGDIVLEGGAENIATSILFIGTNVDHISCAFDVNMSPIIAWQVNGKSYLRYFYNSGSGNLWTIKEFDSTTSCRVVQDEFDQDKSVISDVMFFFTNGTSLQYARQRDNFGTNFSVGATSGIIRRAGRSEGGRLQIEILP